MKIKDFLYRLKTGLAKFVATYAEDYIPREELKNTQDALQQAQQELEVLGSDRQGAYEQGALFKYEAEQAQKRATQVVVASIGDRRRLRQLELELSKAQVTSEEAERLRRSVRRLRYSTGKYEKVPILLADFDSRIVFQNRAAVRLLDNRRIRGLRLADYIHMAGNKKQKIRIGDNFYQLSIRGISKGYQVEVKSLPRYRRFKDSKAPYFISIPKILLPSAASSQEQGLAGA